MSIDIDNHFATSLREVRKQKKITQTELAKKAGLDRTYISMLERGVRKPSTEVLMSIANVLEVSACVFIKEIEAKLGTS